jgi:hypothetical protein
LTSHWLGIYQEFFHFAEASTYLFFTGGGASLFVEPFTTHVFFAEFLFCQCWFTVFVTFASHVRSLTCSNTSDAAKNLTLFCGGLPNGFNNGPPPAPARHAAGSSKPKPPVPPSSGPVTAPTAAEIDFVIRSYQNGM